MKLQRVYYKSSRVKAPRGKDFLYEDEGKNGTELLVYHYWICFDDICLYYSPLEISLSVCEAPSIDATPFSITCNAMLYEEMHDSFIGAELKSILNCGERELLFFLLFDNGNHIYFEKFIGRILEPPIENPYGRLYFETAAADTDGLDWLIPHCKVISAKEVYKKRIEIGQTVT